MKPHLTPRQELSFLFMSWYYIYHFIEEFRMRPHKNSFLSRRNVKY